MTSRRPWWKPRRSRRPQRLALLIVVGSLCGAAVAGYGAYRRIVHYPDAPLAEDTTPIAFEIPKGSALPTAVSLLVEHGVLSADDQMAFRLFVLHEGAAGKITAGPHVFSRAMTPKEVLTELTRPQKAKELVVTIPEGRNLLEVAQLLEQAGLGRAADHEAAMRDKTLLAELGIPGETIEGYLFPDTYKFPADARSADILRRLVREHQRVFSDLERRHRAAIKHLHDRLGFGPHEIVILASIIEKETGAKHERPLIASVFLNRLTFSSFTPKLLQTDPTIVYGCTVPVTKSAACQTFEGRIRRIHLRDTENPYNTYTHERLPPGPISNPGRAALEAVLAPKKSSFLYFVARNDKTHQFSKTEAEHEAFVDLYQRKGAVGDGSAEGSVDRNGSP